MKASYFPDHFIWGVATASYQIEGAAYEDGKGLSVWDQFCKKEGAILYGDNGDIACDHYHHYAEDIQLMSQLIIPAYRFSLSWPRILPEGTGHINQKGLDFYDRLVDSLLEKNITPHVTLFHWDYPQALLDKGGWLHPDSPLWFEEYTRVVVERLSDRVEHWMTLNEPFCHIFLGHKTGEHAPGFKLSDKDILQIIHNTYLAHGRSVLALRSLARRKPRVGIAMVGSPVLPATESPEDIEAARQAMFNLKGDGSDLSTIGLWFDPLFLGKYPEGYEKVFAGVLPDIGPEDMKIMSQPLDFLGLNIYYSGRVRMGKDGPEGIPETLGMGRPRTTMNWPITPEGLYWGPRFFYERYKLPIYITENGMANLDWVYADGKVHDPQRIDFLTRYLLQLNRALSEGVDVRAFMHWSLLDNFEWAFGFDRRFGLIHVDYQTQKRTLKDSAYWYSTLIQTNGRSLFNP